MTRILGWWRRSTWSSLYLTNLVSVFFSSSMVSRGHVHLSSTQIPEWSTSHALLTTGKIASLSSWYTSPTPFFPEWKHALADRLAATIPFVMQSLHHWLEDIAEDRLWTPICILGARSWISLNIHTLLKTNLGVWNRDCCHGPWITSNFGSSRNCNQCRLLSSLMHTHKEDARAGARISTFVLLMSPSGQGTVLREAQRRLCVLMCHALSLQRFPSLKSLLTEGET